jgi:iron(III) transport system substrate-binding protein
MSTNAHRRLGWPIVVVVVILATLAPSCAKEQVEHPGGEVVLYTSMPQSVVDQLEGVIEDRFPDLDGNRWMPVGGEHISLTVVRGRTADIEQQIAEDVEDGQVNADLIWLAEPSPYERYKDTGLLAPYAPPAGAPIPIEYVDPDGYYVAGRVMSMVLVWNTDLCPGGLSDWKDLLRAEPNAFPAPQSGAARKTIEALIDRYGRGFLMSLAASGTRSVADNETARDGVADGEYEAAVVLDYMARQAKDGGEPVDYAYAASGTLVIPSPIAITADGPNPAAAKLVADFILSRAGQKIVVQIGSFYPARTDVDPPEGAPPLNEITTLPFDWDALADDGAITRLWDDTFGLGGAATSSVHRG